MRITISGPIGSGKTTVCNLLSKRLGYTCVVSGNIFREMAKEHKMSLAEFGALCERDMRYDRLLDDRMVEIARDNPDIILEGRLVAYMLEKNGIPALKFFLTADLETRAKRVVEREGKQLETAMLETREREESEAVRYRSYYGINIKGDDVYDVVIDTADKTPEQIVDIMVEKVEEWKPQAC
jgi:predicted cytidylate kinase